VKFLNSLSRKLRVFVPKGNNRSNFAYTAVMGDFGFLVGDYFLERDAFLSDGEGKHFVCLAYNFVLEKLLDIQKMMKL
jgi:hypothetical protein